MKRLLLILTIASVTLCQTVHAQYYSVNYDTRTVAAMVAEISLSYSAFLLF